VMSDYNGGADRQEEIDQSGEVYCKRQESRSKKASRFGKLFLGGLWALVILMGVSSLVSESELMLLLAAAVMIEITLLGLLVVVEL
jgi:hypothetical protein